MSIKKVTLASLILLGLTACGSSGSGGSSNNVAKPNTKPQTTQQQTDKAAKDKAAKEKAERLTTEKVAKEKAEAERLAAEKATKEKAEAERLVAEKAAKEKAEAERLAAEKVAKEKEEAERLALEKAAKEKAEAERLATEKAAKEKAEAERLAAEKAAREKAEAERLAAEKAAKEKAEAERLAAEKVAKDKAEIERLKALAIKAGYSDSEAENFAKDNLNGDPNNYLSGLGWEKYNKVKEAALYAGFSEENASSLASKYSGVEENVSDAFTEIAQKAPIIKAKGIDDENYGIRFNGFKETNEGRVKVRTQSYLYNQPYSVVTAQEVERKGWENGKYIDKSDKTITVKGLKTEKLPTEGKATYEGKAFNYHGDYDGGIGGYLTYNVDFTNRTGSGKVEGSYARLITLDQGNLEQNSISSTASLYYGSHHHGDGRYKVEFFGPNAEEISGQIKMETDIMCRRSNLI
ncbi:factor H binding protein domain-containing protein [Mannheimia haemolytica]|uniref:factor H binding protein domain-containing protein n=1 Tax=Mannheimia haemolytica TaxID=75985 RepID=UPI002ECE4392|nr:factor H binding protein domain-containing protein [Mannheimia haemolytica]